MVIVVGQLDDYWPNCPKDMVDVSIGIRSTFIDHADVDVDVDKEVGGVPAVST